MKYTKHDLEHKALLPFNEYVFAPMIGTKAFGKFQKINLKIREEEENEVTL